ncbi:cytochrome P450 monooxygenase ptmJ [Trichoderma asperellum]|uniref:Cytochrome P450 monooxygenase ptmJ n=1 Tax=Trichoderma asperellum TaxID=101201 RepID=A0A6V8QV84_TRIAP|nr:cytochrome P450 monooxygenase ptmJ [Trichoderma asperellum]
MSIDKLWLLAAGSITAVAYFAVRLVHHRLKYRDLPCPPHSMLWGHLKVFGKYVKSFPQGAYIQPTITQLKIDYNLPDIFYLDLWPLGPQFMILAAPEACAIPTTENTFDQHDVVTDFFNRGVGTGFIEATNGALWKHLHRTLAPGLTPSIVKGYYPTIVEEAVAIRRRFWGIAKSGEVADIRHELGHFPFNVMGKVLLDETLSVQIYEDICAAFDAQTAVNRTDNPFTKWRLGKDVRRQDLMQLMLDNAKGLLLAGFGTTADTSTYILMLLSAFPEALQKLREEHDRVFDKDHDKTVQMLQEQPGLIRSLPYTTAVINETLRMFNAGLSIRVGPSTMPTMEYKGRSYPLKDQVVAISQHAMHCDSKYFDEPKLFKPDRFMSEEPSFPRNAYRPFEKGLRSCLGQPLAMDEMKIMLVMVARSFDFELRDHNPSDKPKYSFTDLDTKLGDHAIQHWAYTAGPAGKVMMKVTERSTAN